MKALRSLTRALIPQSAEEVALASKTERPAGTEVPVGETLLLAALEAQSPPEPWSVRDGANSSEFVIGWQGEDERLDVALCILESLRPASDRISQVYLRQATALIVRESEPRGGISERQYLLAVPAKDTGPID